MKIINFVYFGVVNSPNGAATFYRNLFYHRSEFQIDNFCKPCFYAQDLSVLSDSENVPVAVSKGKGIRLRLQKYAMGSFLFSLLGLYVFCLRHALKVIKKMPDYRNERNDLTFFFNDIFSAYFFLRKRGKCGKVVLILHNDGEATKMLYGQFPRLKGSFVGKYIEKSFVWLISQCDDIVLLSLKSKELFHKLYGIYLTTQRIHVIYNAVESIPISLSNITTRKELVGVSVGTISYRKGFDLLSKAVKQNNVVNPESPILIKCIGNLQDKEIVDNNDSEFVQFLGPLSHSDIVKILSDADFFILCSRDEGMPISILEAMQCRLPIFATNVGAISEMFSDGVEGIIFNPTLYELSEVLKNISNGKYNLKMMGNASFKKYQDCYSIDKMMNSYKKILLYES